MGDPFTDELGIGALQINPEMIIVCRREFFYLITPECQFFGKMKDSPKNIGEPLMFQEIGVFEKLKKEGSLVEEKFLKIMKGRLFHFDAVGKL